MKPCQMNLFEIAACFHMYISKQLFVCEQPISIWKWAHNYIYLVSMCWCSLFFWQQSVWSGICRKSNQSAAAKDGKQIVVVISATESCGSLKVMIQSRLNCAAAEHRVKASTLRRDNFPKSEFLWSEESQVENVKNAIDILNARWRFIEIQGQRQTFALHFIHRRHHCRHWLNQPSDTNLLTNMFSFYLSFRRISDDQITHFLFCHRPEGPSAGALLCNHCKEIKAHRIIWIVQKEYLVKTFWTQWLLWQY